MTTDGRDQGRDGRRRKGSWAWFAGWVAAGSLFSLSLLGILSIGIFVLPIAVFLAVALAVSSRGRRSRGSGWGALCGASLPLFFVAFLNRRGPGTICDVTPVSSSCVETWSPWPWAAVGLAMVTGGVAAFSVARRPRALPPPPPSGTWAATPG